MTNLEEVAAYIAWQEERTLEGKTATLEEYREHLDRSRDRRALEEILKIAEKESAEGEYHNAAIEKIIEIATTTITIKEITES